MLKITLKRGLVGKKDTQIKIVKALGLRKFGSSVVHADSPTIRGMVNKIGHLITVETVEVKDEDKKPFTKKKPIQKPAAASAAANRAAEAAKPAKAEAPAAKAKAKAAK